MATDDDDEAMLDAIDAACARGDHDFDNSFTHPPRCPDCDTPQYPDPFDDVEPEAP